MGLPYDIHSTHQLPIAARYTKQNCSAERKGKSRRIPKPPSAGGTGRITLTADLVRTASLRFNRELVRYTHTASFSPPTARLFCHQTEWHQWLSGVNSDSMATGFIQFPATSHARQSELVAVVAPQSESCVNVHRGRSSFLRGKEGDLVLVWQCEFCFAKYIKCFDRKQKTMMSGMTISLLQRARHSAGMHFKDCLTQR